jgi:hypothetical protein
MDYKTVFVPMAGKIPTKYADQLTKDLKALDNEGYEAFAITPLVHDNGSTVGFILSARKRTK